MPKMKLGYKFQRFLEVHKPLKVAYGGRGSGKSIGFGDMLTMKMQTEAADIYCLREYQDSISDSVHRVFKDSIEKRLQLQGWIIQKNEILSPCGSVTKYKGASRNPDSIQSAQGYKYSWFEEAHKASQASLDKLIPTIIRNPGAECWFSANPQSSGDPFSQRFIVPYLQTLNADGYYEDDVHLIIRVNWRDNPWWNEEQERIRLWDFNNRSRARYDHIWEGAFDDSVEDPLILAEWFDACIDAHKKLGFEPLGIRYSAHDPSDEGSDAKGFAFRHGSVVLDLREKTTGNVNEGCDWATGLAIKHDSDAYTWDCDGMGVALNRQVAGAFNGHHTRVLAFKGSENPDNPEAIYEPVEGIAHQKTTKEAVKNKRAQFYLALRDRIHRTYLAVNGAYHDPDTLLSFDSSLKALTQLRSELCRMPVKPNANGLFQLYTKDEMKTKFKFNSPNLADSVMMLMRTPAAPMTQTVRPAPIRPMGIRR